MKLIKVYIVLTILFLMGIITFKSSIQLINSKLNLLSSVANSIDDFSEEEDSEENEKTEKELKYLFSESLETLTYTSLQQDRYTITKESSLPNVSIVPETPPPSII